MRPYPIRYLAKKLIDGAKINPITALCQGVTLSSDFNNIKVDRKSSV